MKKSVNANVLKGRFVLPNPVPSPASPSSAQNLSPTKDLIAVILDDQSPDDVRLARDLGVDHVGGQDLLDRVGFLLTLSLSHTHTHESRIDMAVFLISMIVFCRSLRKRSSRRSY